MPTKELPLKTSITRLLGIELGLTGVVTCPDDVVTIVISRENCEQNYGNILQQIHRVIEEAYPIRRENLFIRVQDESGGFKHIVKIWKSI